MDVKIIEKKENPLLDRLEIFAVAEHPKEATPKREEIRKRIAALLGVSDEVVVVKKILSVYGWAKSKIIAHVYKNKEALFRLEPKYILRRNGLLQEKS